MFANWKAVPGRLPNRASSSGQMELEMEWGWRQQAEQVAELGIDAICFCLDLLEMDSDFYYYSLVLL